MKQISLLTSVLGLAIPASAAELVQRYDKTATRWEQEAAALTPVATDVAGRAIQQPHLLVGNRGKYPTGCKYPPGTINAVDSLVFGYAGLTPSAVYQLKVGLVSDNGCTQRIKAGELVLAEKLVLDAGKPTDFSVVIPPAAYANGELCLNFEKVEGEDAGLTEVTILSSCPTPLLDAPVADRPVPRLSPLPQQVAGCGSPQVDLGGVWKFNPDPPKGFQSLATLPAGWADIQVPGEWSMQGFTVKKNTAAGYWRTFSLPADWAGKRIKLRCNAVYSDATVWVNGQEVGKHSGGFTPFELDITDAVKPGAQNTLALSVLNDSVADRLASGSRYACHPLGGIPRSLHVFALTETHLAALKVVTTFDAEYRHATLALDLEAAAEGARRPEDLFVKLALTSPEGKAVALPQTRFPLQGLRGSIALPVPDAQKWDSEHPRLYTLQISLESAGQTLETLTQKVGFRQIVVRGNELLVNGQPVKLHGVNHHEVYPTTGRSVPAGLHRKDVELFRAANVNLLRTCHYPPDEALLAAADELGMFIECEAPFCWAPANGDNELVWSQTADMAIAYRNHPSILFWSLANESTWGRQFVESSTLLRRLDPTRPQVFNDCGSVSDPKYTDLMNCHYDGHGGPLAVRRGKAQPFYHGEDVHLNAYNRLELATDPALRDQWGRYLRQLWDDMYVTQGSLGMSIWAGIDDTFYIGNDQTAGYGTWGPIDGWRREKPEYWNMKKAYSPIRILGVEAPSASDGSIVISLENRHNFTPLNELNITWKIGSQSGVAKADLAAGTKGSFRIQPATTPRPGEAVELEFADARGFVTDQFRLPLAGSSQPVPAKVVTTPATLATSETTYTVTNGGTWQIDRKSGQLTRFNDLPLSGPALMVLALNKEGSTQMSGKTTEWTPFTSPCTGWTCSAVTAKEEGGSVRISVAGSYTGAKGTYELLFQNGELEIQYAFTVSEELTPRQIGLVFSLPRACETLTWKRQGYWDVYPQDHIARLEGTVKASEGFEATSVGPRTQPSHPWRLDKLPYGNNDFCSTKHNIDHASLTDATGQGLAVKGAGRQHVRAWQAPEATGLLVADYSNGGSERFLRKLASADDRPLKPGDEIKGTVTVTGIQSQSATTAIEAAAHSDAK